LPGIRWRHEHADIRPDLSEANLTGADLNNADLFEAHLIKANLVKADLRWANLSGASLSEANLVEAVKTVQAGGTPRGTEATYYTLRAAEGVIPREADWHEILTPEMAACAVSDPLHVYSAGVRVVLGEGTAPPLAYCSGCAWWLPCSRVQ
jgi:hypothetical protein